MRRRMARALAAAACSIAAVLAGCASSSTSKATAAAEAGTSRPAVPAGAAERLEDLDALVAGLEKGHPAFRGRAGASAKAGFEARAEELRAVLPGLGTEEAEVGMARLVASLGDAHTGLVLPTFALLPLDVYRYEDGWRVTSAAESCSGLLGLRLVSIGGVAISDIESRLESVVPHDNGSGLASQMKYRLLMPDILAGTGILEPGASSAAIVAEADDGALVEAEAPFWRYGESEPAFIAMKEPESPALSLGRTDEAYWCAMVPGTMTLYIAYNRCRDDPKRPIKGFAKEVDRILGSGAVDRVLVDLRNNGGGSSPVFWPLLRVLASHAKGRAAIPVFAAVGRRTFSSAVLNAMELARGAPGLLGKILAPSAQAVLVGEGLGGSPNHYGETRSFALPRSGFRVQYSTKRFENWPGLPDALEPDIAAPPTWADRLSGRDAALEAVLSLDLAKGGDE